jgi:hypothetical protein
MTTLKSVNWARGWRRLIWTLFFAAFYALVVYMAKDMAGTQPVVFGIILLAAIVCAVAFVYSRTSKEALVIALLALCVHAFLEISYWSAVVDDTSTQAMREQAAATSRDVVNEKRRARYASSASGKGAGQLAAEVEVLKQDARWMSSGQCTNAAAPASRTFCQDYYRLVADLAAAKEAANLEKVVFHTSVERVDIPRNLAKGALWLSDVTTMSVQTATNILVGLMVLFIQAGVALCLRVGWEPERPQEAAGATFQQPLTLTASKFDPAYSSLPVAPRTPMKPLEKIAGVKAANLPEIPDSSPAPESKALTLAIEENARTPDPDGPGTPAPAPEEPVEEVAEDRTNVLPLKPRQETNAQYRIEREEPTKKRRDRPETKDFIRECLAVDKEALTAMLSAIRDKKALDKRVSERLMESPDAYDMYVEWCGDDYAPISSKAFSNQLGEAVGLPKGTRKMKGVKGIRNAKGMKFPVFDVRAASVPAKKYA